MKGDRVLLGVTLMVLSGTMVFATPSSTNYSLPWSMAGGGGGAAGSTSYQLFGTVHSPAGPATSSASYVLTGGFLSPPDSDADAVPDFLDNCPYASNADQADSGGIGTGSAADGIGDACQCGDVNNNGIVDNTDAVLIKRFVLGLPPGINPDKCNINSGSTCNNTDAVLIQRAVLGLPPGLSQSCVAAVPAP